MQYHDVKVWGESVHLGGVTGSENSSTSKGGRPAGAVQRRTSSGGVQKGSHASGSCRYIRNSGHGAKKYKGGGKGPRERRPFLSFPVDDTKKARLGISYLLRCLLSDAVK